jgi:hypothetical protein
MYSPPYIFFHGYGPQGFRWADNTNPALHQLSTLDNAPHDLLSSLSVNVSKPDTLLAWLDTNNAALISDLTIFVEPVDTRPQLWCALFRKLQNEAMGVENLDIYWDAEWGGGLLSWFGLGRSVEFVREVAKLKVRNSVVIRGFYGRNWPDYLEQNMGLRPVEDFSSNEMKRSLRIYQKGTEHLNP